MTRVVLVHAVNSMLNRIKLPKLLNVATCHHVKNVSSIPSLEKYDFFWASSHRKRLKQEILSQPVLLVDYNYIFGQLHLLYFASKLQENILSKIILKDSLLSLL